LAGYGQRRTLRHHVGVGKSNQEEFSFLRCKSRMKLGAALRNPQ